MSTPDRLPTCGIVMPISALDGCGEAHWSDVQAILTEAIEDAGFEANLVSNADDVGIIQKRIIQNLYDNPVVVCDVSGKNPNVMFELGMRLAFDKPTIIVKDDATAYSFDTAPIEHIAYPRDLRFGRIIEFKSLLADKIRLTFERSISDAEYTTLLKHFGEFKVAKIDKKEVTSQEFILEELKSLRSAVLANDRYRPSFYEGNDFVDICLRGRSDLAIESTRKTVELLGGVSSARVQTLGEGHRHLHVRFSPDSEINSEELRRRIRSITNPQRGFGRARANAALDDAPSKEIN